MTTRPDLRGQPATILTRQGEEDEASQEDEEDQEVKEVDFDRGRTGRQLRSPEVDSSQM